MTGQRGNFFAVDGAAWAKVCALGINASVAYLVIARGSQADNRTSAWSVNAVEQRTGISRPRAVKAVEALIAAKLLQRTGSTTAPVYSLQTGADMADDAWIWLPNELVDGAVGEVPPVELVRQSQNALAMRLLVDLYKMHDLANEGGIQWRKGEGIRQEYTKSLLYRFGEFDVYSFTETQKSYWVLAKALDGYFGKKPICARDDIWPAIGILETLRLLRFKPHLVEADTAVGEILHTLAHIDVDPIEAEIACAVYRAAQGMLPASIVQNLSGRELLVPVPRHQSAVEVIGIGRLRYRPKTRATAAWYRPDEWKKWADRYVSMAQKTSTIQGHAISR